MKSLREAFPGTHESTVRSMAVMRTAGFSWQKMADLFEVHKQAMHRKYAAEVDAYIRQAVHAQYIQDIKELKEMSR